MSKVEVILFNSLIGNPLQAWGVMLILGALHHSVSEQFPATGYVLTVGVCGIVNFCRINFTEDDVR